MSGGGDLSGSRGHLFRGGLHQTNQLIFLLNHADNGLLHGEEIPLEHGGVIVDQTAGGHLFHGSVHMGYTGVQGFTGLVEFLGNAAQIIQAAHGNPGAENAGTKAFHTVHQPLDRLADGSGHTDGDHQRVDQGKQSESAQQDHDLGGGGAETVQHFLPGQLLGGDDLLYHTVHGFPCHQQILGVAAHGVIGAAVLHHLHHLGLGGKIGGQQGFQLQKIAGVQMVKITGCISGFQTVQEIGAVGGQGGEQLLLALGVPVEQQGTGDKFILLENGQNPVDGPLGLAIIGVQGTAVGENGADAQSTQQRGHGTKENDGTKRQLQFAPDGEIFDGLQHMGKLLYRGNVVSGCTIHSILSCRTVLCVSQSASGGVKKFLQTFLEKWLTKKKK